MSFGSGVGVLAWRKACARLGSVRVGRCGRGPVAYKRVLDLAVCVLSVSAQKGIPQG
jgi:hypothetical protein